MLGRHDRNLGLTSRQDEDEREKPTGKVLSHVFTAPTMLEV